MFALQIGPGGSTATADLPCAEPGHPDHHLPDDPWAGDGLPSDGWWPPGAPPEPQPPLGELPASGFTALELELATRHPAGMADTQLIDATIGLDRVISWAQARQARLLAEFARRRGDTAEAFHDPRPSPSSSYAPDEIGVALRISRGSAMIRLNQARALDELLPEVLTAWETGLVDGGKVRAITDATGFLVPEDATAVAGRVLDRAPEQSVAELRAALARAIIEIDPAGAAQRHRAARRDRRVAVHPQPEGMASLWALLSAPDARSAWEWLTRLARGLGADDPRGMDARRADLLVALLTGRLTADDLRDPSDPSDPSYPSDSLGLPDTGQPTGLADTGLPETDQPDPDPGPGPGPGEPDPGQVGDHGVATTTDDTVHPADLAATTAGSTTHPAVRQTPRPSDVDDPGGAITPSAPGTGETGRPARERLRPVSPGKPLVQVVIPYSTLVGAEQAPGELAGYGPIPAELAREIAADAVWTRLVTDPLSGALLDHGRDTYRPPAPLADFVRARDVHCRGPRCRRPATNSELDHHRPYPGGPTAEPNLWAACRHHHDLKHHGGWQVLLHPDRTLEWITPTGHRHTTRPHDYRPRPEDLRSGLPEPEPPPPTPPRPVGPDPQPPPF